jgi:hypothetical protein
MNEELMNVLITADDDSALNGLLERRAGRLISDGLI